jgi:hypothetical protein
MSVFKSTNRSLDVETSKFLITQVQLLSSSPILVADVKFDSLSERKPGFQTFD